ncbi:hypothetical protein ACR782_16145 [Sphingobacterium spiritivorum]
MKQGMILFWLLYMLFFCIPFPIGLHLAIYDDSRLPSNSVLWSSVFLSLSVVIWIYLLSFYINQFLIKNVRTKQEISRIFQSGIRRRAVVTESAVVKYDDKRESNLMRIKLQFENRNGVSISDEQFFWDTRPYEYRFEQGKEVSVLLNDNPDKEPYFIMEEQRTQYNTSGILIRVAILILFIAYIAGLYIYFYHRESKGYGWHFVSFTHPVVMTGFSMLVLVFLYKRLVKKFIFGKKRDRNLLYSGAQAVARINQVRQTGLTVNDQPEVRFEVSFTDTKGQLRHAAYKKIISLIDLPLIPRSGEINILYDTDKPENIIIPDLLAER